MFLTWLLLPVILTPLVIALAMVCLLALRPEASPQDIAKALATVIRAMKDSGRRS